MKTSSGGTVSFRKKGRLDAAFVRVETTNIVLLSAHGEYLTIPATNLSEVDRCFVVRATEINPADALLVGQSAIVKNEMTRRKLEAAKLRDDAAARHHLAEVELVAADELEAQAVSLASRAGDLLFQAQTNEVSVENPIHSLDPSPLAGAVDVRAKGDASMASGVAAQLEEDIARIRRQAQGKRRRAENLQREAAQLEKIAEAELNPDAKSFVQ